MSDTPSISSAFKTGSDPSELREASVALARALENARAVDKVHWSHIIQLNEDSKRQDTAITKLADGFQLLTQRMVRIETKMALYALLGAAIGGGMVAAVMKLLFK